MWLGSTDVTSYLTGSRSQCDPLEPRLVIPYDGAAQMKKKKNTRWTGPFGRTSRQRTEMKRETRHRLVGGNSDGM